MAGLQKQFDNGGGMSRNRPRQPMLHPVRVLSRGRYLKAGNTRQVCAGDDAAAEDKRATRVETANRACLVDAPVINQCEMIFIDADLWGRAGEVVSGGEGQKKNRQAEECQGGHPGGDGQAERQCNGNTGDSPFLPRIGSLRVWQ